MCAGPLRRPGFTKALHQPLAFTCLPGKSAVGIAFTGLELTCQRATCAILRGGAAAETSSFVGLGAVFFGNSRYPRPAPRLMEDLHVQTGLSSRHSVAARLWGKPLDGPRNQQRTLDAHRSIALSSAASPTLRTQRSGGIRLLQCLRAAGERGQSRCLLPCRAAPLNLGGRAA